MKRIQNFVPAAIAFIAVFLMALPGNAADKIATIDLDQVFKGYYKTKRAEQVINDRLAEFRKVRQEKQDVLRKLQEEVEELDRQINDPTISTTKKEELSKENEAKKARGRQLLQEFQEDARKMDQELDLQSNRLRKEILDDIKKVIERRAREQAINFVFDTSGLSANNAPVILFSDTRSDITQDVLTILNREAPPLPPPPRP